MTDYRANLRKLAEYLAKLPDDYADFEMGTFFGRSRWYGIENPDIERKYALENGGVGKCGAVACAIGHGPSAGFLMTDDLLMPHGRALWAEYIERFFIADYVGCDERDEAYAVFEWMFGGDWSDHDNTPRGAAQRIVYFLENGHPFDWNGDNEEWDTQIGGNLVSLYEDLKI